MKTINAFNNMALTFLFTQSAFSQTSVPHEHSAGGQHGGLVQQAGDRHIELVRMNEQEGKSLIAVYSFYLLDSAMNTLANHEKTGLAFFQTSDGITAQEKLLPEGTEKFTCKVQLSGVVTLLIVTIKEDDKDYTATFRQRAPPILKPQVPSEHNSGGHSH